MALRRSCVHALVHVLGTIRPAPPRSASADVGASAGAGAGTGVGVGLGVGLGVGFGTNNSAKDILQARAFIARVQAEYAEQPEVYRKFLSIITECSSGVTA